MAIKQSTLNNNMSGVTANTIYQATHGGSLGGDYVTGYKNSGNYTDSSNGNVSYYLGSPTVYDPKPNGDDPTGGNRTKTGGDAGGSASTAGISIGGGGGGGYDYASMISQMLAEQRAAAEAAYARSKANLDTAWGDTTRALKDNLNAALGQLQKNYEYGQGVANDDAAKSLREAYVNYMLNRKNINQNLAAAGVSGGATESGLAKLYNNYGNSRNNINTTLAENLAELLNTYQNNVSSANQAYNSQFADARNNYMNQLNALESMLAGNMMSTYSGGSLSSLANYANVLSNLIGNSEAAVAAIAPTANTLGVNTVSSTQGNNMGSITDYAKYLAMLEQMGQAV